MDLETVIRKFIRLPWEVCDGQEHWRDCEVSNIIEFECHAGDSFKTPPPKEYREIVLQSVARTLVIALSFQKGGVLEKRNKFNTLTIEEKNCLFQRLGIQPRQYSFLLLEKDPFLLDMLPSYCAAAYAFTTWTKPFVCDFDLLYDVAYQAQIDKPREEYAMRCAGLFILKGLGVPSKSANEVPYAYLHSLLNRRFSKRRMNMFVHAPVGALLSTYSINKLPTRSTILDVYLKYIPGHYMIHNALCGLCTHMGDVDIMESRKKDCGDERRQSVVI